MTANGLIDLTLKEIVRYYQPGVLAYMKKTTPVEWGKLLAIEQEINRTALEDDFEGLRKALETYKQAVLGVEHGESQGNLFRGLTDSQDGPGGNKPQDIEAIAKRV